MSIGFDLSSVKIYHNTPLEPNGAWVGLNYKRIYKDGVVMTPMEVTKEYPGLPITFIQITNNRFSDTKTEDYRPNEWNKPEESNASFIVALYPNNIVEIWLCNNRTINSTMLQQSIIAGTANNFRLYRGNPQELGNFMEAFNLPLNGENSRTPLNWETLQKFRAFTEGENTSNV